MTLVRLVRSARAHPAAGAHPPARSPVAPPAVPVRPPRALHPMPGPAGALVLTYRPGLPNLCPGCHSTHWHVGRITAECAHCGTALPIATDRPGWSRSG